jgi:hypothetical protein
MLITKFRNKYMKENDNL